MAHKTERYQRYLSRGERGEKERGQKERRERERRERERREKEKRGKRERRGKRAHCTVIAQLQYRQRSQRGAGPIDLISPPTFPPTTKQKITFRKSPENSIFCRGERSGDFSFFNIKRETPHSKKKKGNAIWGQDNNLRPGWQFESFWWSRGKDDNPFLVSVLISARSAAFTPPQSPHLGRGGAPRYSHAAPPPPTKKWSSYNFPSLTKIAAF